MFYIKSVVCDIFTCIFIVLFISCDNNSVLTVRVNAGDFINVETLDGKDVVFDTIPGVCGSVIPLDSLYFCYLYRSDNYLMITDREFNIKGYTAHKGTGPGEVSQVSFLYGHILNDVDFAVLDIDKRIVYGCDLDNWIDLCSKLSFATQSNVPAPLYFQELNSGKFLMARMDYEYGLFTYDRTDDSVDYWPVGLELPENKKYEISCGRGMAYNRANDIVAEYYSALPMLILHDADGEVRHTLQYADMPRWDDIKEDSPNMIEDICMTDNYIFTLLGGDDQENDAGTIRSIIYVTDYSGNPIGCLKIKQAYSISIDEVCRRMITVNPNAENNITLYNLPDWI